jgi:hypothetical protein
MGWEKRGEKSYYYRKKREGGRVVSEYLGRGESAVLLSQFDRYDQLKNQINAEEKRKSREKEAEIDCKFKEIEQEINVLVEKFLMENGFYKTSSREWRLKGDYGKEKD